MYGNAEQTNFFPRSIQIYLETHPNRGASIQIEQMNIWTFFHRTILQNFIHITIVNIEIYIYLCIVR